MDKNYKPVYIHGTKSGKGVIEALETLGGKNKKKLSGIDEDSIYYIDPEDNTIHLVTEYSDFGKYIIATAKELKPFRWRAERTEAYYTLDSTLDVIESTEYGDRYDDGRYNSGNYYRTRKDAEKAAKKIKEVLLPN